MKTIAAALAVVLLSGTSLLADFSYEQTSKITGGAMASMMKIAGAFSKQAREPIQTSVVVKGDRMANLSARSAQIIDLKSETITEVNFEKKTYSVLTFAQFAEALKAMETKMRGSGDGQAANVKFTPSVKETGQKRTVAGLEARQVVLKIDMETTDPKTGKSGTMTMTADMWLANVPGYAEVQSFHKRMGEKLNFMPGQGMAMQPGSAQGMAALVKEASKLDGVPVYQVTKMGGVAPQGEAGAAPRQPQQQQQAEAEKPSVGGALGRLGGSRLGLGGFGRKKKQEEPPAAQPAAAQQPPADNAGVLMELTTELSGFSASAVDASKLEVPAGFKQVESEMLKNSRK